MTHATGKVMDKLMNWIKAQSRQPKLFVLDIIIAGLTVFLIFMIGYTAEEVSYSYDTYDENNFYWRLESEDYSSMVNMYYMNVAEGKGDAKELQEYYGVARYFEAAADYKMYVDAGETARAESALADMEEAYVQMGDFSMVKGKIDAKLGLE